MVGSSTLPYPNMNLTPRQREAVETDAAEVLVIAGAGSGKTRVLTERVAHLLCDCGASPSELMVLTFTRKAAGEMKSRLFAALQRRGWDDPERECRGMLIGTFHAVAFDMLRSHGDKLGYSPEHLTVIEPADRDMLIKQVARDLGYLKGDTWGTGLSMKKVLTFVEKSYVTGHAVTPENELEFRCSKVFSEYCARLFSLNALDFGHILLQCKYLLGSTDVVQAYCTRIKHVLVDEIQDANTIQHYGFLDFFPQPATFFAVGDRRQSIYRFRGARPDLMTEKHPAATVIDLQDCFRCGADIVAAANSLIAVNADPLAKPMISATGRDGAVELRAGRSADIADTVKWCHHMAGFQWESIAVLARTHRTLKRLDEVFEDTKIPHYRVGGGLEICDTDEFRLLHAALRLSVNPRDNLAFLRLAPQFGLCASEYSAVRARAAKDGIGDFAAMGVLGLLKNELAKLVAGPDPREEDPRLSLYVRQLASAMPHLRLAASDWWVEYCIGMDVPEALRWFALRDVQDDVPEKQDVVTLLTVHAAKGLEWPCVIIVGLNEKEFPCGPAVRDPDEMEEERRLCYVGITRGAERVTLHWRRAVDQAKPRPGGRKVIIKAPSRFLKECGLFGKDSNGNDHGNKHSL
jgi:superfamily I DNA/RNA helicase